MENELDFASCVEDWPSHDKMSLSYLFDKLSLSFEMNGKGEIDPGLHCYNCMSQYYTQCKGYI